MCRGQVSSLLVPSPCFLVLGSDLPFTLPLVSSSQLSSGLARQKSSNEMFRSRRLAGADPRHLTGRHIQNRLMIDVRLVSLATILQPPGVFLQIFLQIVQVQEECLIWQNMSACITRRKTSVAISSSDTHTFTTQSPLKTLSSDIKTPPHRCSPPP